MNTPRAVAVTLAIFSCGIAWLAGAAGPQQSIQAVIHEQTDAWNRGDLKGFVASYAEHCTLVGNEISETTRAEVLEHYRRKYPSRDAMGTLNFSDLTVHLLDARFATVTGRWHLARNKAAGGAIGGVFSLVLENAEGKWQITLDHTS